MNPPAVLTNINRNEAFIVRGDSEVYTGPQSEDADDDPAEAALWTKGNSKINGVSPQEVSQSRLIFILVGLLLEPLEMFVFHTLNKATTIHHFKTFYTTQQSSTKLY